MQPRAQDKRALRGVGRAGATVQLRPQRASTHVRAQDGSKAIAAGGRRSRRTELRGHTWRQVSSSLVQKIRKGTNTQKHPG